MARSTHIPSGKKGEGGKGKGERGKGKGEDEGDSPVSFSPSAFRLSPFEGLSPSGEHRRVLLPLLLAILTVVWLYRSPWSASTLEVYPDSVEYAVGAQRLATLGRYDLCINGKAYPARYPPGLSLLMAPLYAAAPGELGTGILLILFFAVVAVLAAYLIGSSLGGEWAGVGAALLLLLDPIFTHQARVLMTDVPFCAIGLCGCLLYLRLRKHPSNGATSLYALSGCLVALAFSLRALGIALALPFVVLALFQQRNRCLALTAFLCPILCAVLATAVYNHFTFGDWRRDGYVYWCPVPFEVGLAFSLRHVNINLLPWLGPLATPEGAFLAVLAGATLARDRRMARRDLRAVSWFVALACGAISLVHLLYFYPERRFHLLSFSLLTILTSAGLSLFVPAAWQRRSWILPCMLLMMMLFPPRLRDWPPTRRLFAEAIARSTATDAVILTNIDAVYLEPVALRGTGRQVLPLSRAAEYASKLVAPRKLIGSSPSPRHAADFRARGLVEAGAQEVFPYTAGEAPHRVAAWIEAGRAVYIERDELRVARAARTGLLRRFEFRPVPGEPLLARVVARPVRSARNRRGTIIQPSH
jgi:4-amino-4-deoxy-L-arabinose transferase-like glycosyltransferase